MKKFLFLLLAVVTFASCDRRPTPDEIRLDFMCAFSDYNCSMHKMKLEYMTMVHDTKGAYRPDVDELTDTLKARSEKIVSEAFDSLYIRYGDALVKKVIYMNKGVVLDNKEALHAYFVNAAVKEVLEEVTMEVKVQSILNPTEEDKMEVIREVFEKRGYSLTD